MYKKTSRNIKKLRFILIFLLSGLTTRRTDVLVLLRSKLIELHYDTALLYTIPSQ